MLTKIVAVQMTAGVRLSLAERMFIFKQRPDLVCLPEYALLGNSVPDYQRAALRTADDLDYLIRLSDELSTTLVAGTVVETDGGRLYNTCYIARHGHWIGSYRKQHPVERELERGISAGTSNVVLSIDGVNIGLLICGDVFFPRRFAELADAGVDLICIPTTSRFRPDDTLMRKEQRDRDYFLAGAQAAGAYVIKVCSVGEMLGMPLQGRSLVASPWGILEKIEPAAESKPRLMVATLDVSELREYRIKRAVQRALHQTSVKPATG